MIRKTLPSTQAATFAVELPDASRSGMPVPAGTGFFISADGWFITAAHVVTVDGKSEGAPRTDLDQAWLMKEPRLPTGGPPRGTPMCQWPALELVIPKLDFALLKLDFNRHSNKEFLTGESGFPHLNVSSRVLDDGEPIYAFGYPLSSATVLLDGPGVHAGASQLRPRTTAGIVSSNYDVSPPIMTSTDPEVYIIDRALNFGNSGGPIIASETGNVHAFCSGFQTMAMQQEHLQQNGASPYILVPSLYGTVVSLHNAAILRELDNRGIPIAAT